MINAVSCVSARTVQSWIDIICDLGHSPHIVVKRNVVDSRHLWGPKAILPRHLSLDIPTTFDDSQGVSVWNLSPTAIENYVMDSQLGILSFSAKVKGKAINISVPIEHITNVIVPGYNLNVKVEVLTFATIEDGIFKVTSAIPNDPNNPPPKTTKPKPKLSVVKK